MHLRILNKNFNFYFINKYTLIMKSYYGFFLYKMNSYYFLKNNKWIYKILFINKIYYKSFIKHFFSLYKKLSNIFSIKLRFKGLGYRIRKISHKLYYFFFNYTNMFYILAPQKILIKWYKKKIILISSNFFLLKLLISQMLLLKNIGPYRLRGLRYPKQIIFIKKGTKKN